MAKEKTIAVPAPVAPLHARVAVFNERRLPNARWEYGKLVAAQFVYKPEDGYARTLGFWEYTIALEMLAKANVPVRLRISNPEFIRSL